MPYVPINTSAFVASYAGAIAGMAVSGWIIDPTSADYSDVTIIAGAFAQAFDIAWDDATQLNDLELACMTSVVQTDFNGRGPGPFTSPAFRDPTNWNVAARACVALILECDIFFASQGITPPTPGTAADIHVNRVLFVDTAGVALGANGTLNHPFLTINAAITAAAALTITSIVIKIAPGTYAEEVHVPPSTLTTISFDGWTSAGPEVPNDDLPILSGGMVIWPIAAPPDSPDIFLSNLLFTSTIAGTASTDLQIHLHNVRALGSIEGAILYLYATQSNIGGIVGGSDDTFLFLDGYTWGQIVYNSTVLAPAAKQFFDHGCDVAPSSLNVTGLAIGASQEVAFPHPATLNNEFAIITKTGVPADDYYLTFTHTETASVHAMITNLSRTPGDFADTVATLVFHGTMPTFTPP